MKLLSIAIPCYNSQDYMRHAIETLLAGGEDVEILVVNDGSKDKTADIAAEYQQKYPTIVRAITPRVSGARSSAGWQSTPRRRACRGWPSWAASCPRWKTSAMTRLWA